MNMFPHYLADAAGQDFQVSGNWLIALVVAAIPLIGGVWLKAKAAGRGEMTLSEPVPEVPVKRIYSPPTFHQHHELMRRVDALEKGTLAHREYVEGQFQAIRRENSDQFITLMNAGETRKDAIMTEMHKEMSRIYDRIEKFTDQHKQHG